MPRKSGGSGGGGRSYVNNSMNRSLGRVGMTVGSAPVSSTSSPSSGGYGSSSSYGRSSSTSRSYVDNSMNRNLGRVGLEVGTAPVSRTSSASSSYNSRSASQTYVDNAMNRDLRRVGLPIGTAPVSKNSASKSYDQATQRTYVDNKMNRDLERVGMPIGAAPVSSKSSTSRYCDPPKSDKSVTRSAPSSNQISRSDDRKTSRNSVSKTKVYVDNAYNRQHNRVGLPLGTASLSRSPKKMIIQDVFRKYEEDAQLQQHDFNQNHQFFEIQQQDPQMYELALEMMTRLKFWEQERKAKECSRQKETRGSAPNDSTTQSGRFETYKGAVINYEDLSFEETEPIGHGAFGDIFCAKWKDIVVAVKKLRVQRVSRKRLSQFEEEVNVFSRLSHKNVIIFYGACIKTPKLCMVMELMSGSLYDKIHFEECQFTNEKKIFISKEIACGLKYLHSQDVAHCDIKTTNVLVNIFNNGDINVKLTDFGLSMMKNDIESTTSSLVANVGTPRYSAPEILRGESLSLSQMKMADIYSFGLVLYEIAFEEEPFEGLNIHQLRTQVGYGNKIPEFDDSGIGNNFVTLMKTCWFRQPECRPTTGAALTHLTEISGGQ